MFSLLLDNLHSTTAAYSDITFLFQCALALSRQHTIISSVLKLGPGCLQGKRTFRNFSLLSLIWEEIKVSLWDHFASSVPADTILMRSSFCLLGRVLFPYEILLYVYLFTSSLRYLLAICISVHTFLMRYPCYLYNCSHLPYEISLLSVYLFTPSLWDLLAICISIYTFLRRSPCYMYIYLHLS
jgi:hypothetical protein